MKQKYTISVADMQINVLTEESRESVDYIVGIIDRRMRDIALKSKKCTRNEAAILCALDFCADKLALKKELDELEDAIEDKDEKYEHACEKLELIQKNCERLERERDRLEAEVSRLRALLEGAPASAAKVTETVETEAAPEAVATEEPKAEPAPKKKTGKSRVGTMFDLLTFSDI